MAVNITKYLAKIEYVIECTNPKTSLIIAGDHIMAVVEGHGLYNKSPHIFEVLSSSGFSADLDVTPTKTSGSSRRRLRLQELDYGSQKKSHFSCKPLMLKGREKFKAYHANSGKNFLGTIEPFAQKETKNSLLCNDSKGLISLAVSEGLIDEQAETAYFTAAKLKRAPVPQHLIKPEGRK